MENCKDATLKHACYPANLTMWRDVTLEDFMSCPDNHAANRQAWMLADTDRISCDMDSETVDRVLLKSAKENLLRMSFVGITEMQEESRLLFEDTFNMKFLKKFSAANATLASQAKDSLDKAVIDEIVKINKIDIELYEFARAIMKRRYGLIKSNK